MASLKGRVAIVTGAGQGMGRAVATRLARDGASVMVVDINPQRVPQVKTELEALGAAAGGFVVDLTNLEGVKEMARATVKQFGQIDILCNVAGIGPSQDALSRTASMERKLFWEIDPGQWDFHLRNNLYSVLNCCYAVLPHMIERNYGKIVNWESTASHEAQEGLSLYGTAKGGVFSFTKSLAREAGKHNITVNSVCPSATATDRFEIAGVTGTDTTPETRNPRRTVAPSSPLMRKGTVEECAAVAAFLVSDDASWVTGQSILATGGRWMR